MKVYERYELFGLTEGLDQVAMEERIQHMTDALRRENELNTRLRRRIKGLRIANKQQAKHIERLHKLIGDALKRPKGTP